MHIKDAIERFVCQQAADGRSPHTVAQYGRHVRLFAAWLRRGGHTGDVARIDHDTVARFLTAPAARTNAHGGEKAATSVNCLRTSLKVFAAYLHRAGHAAEDAGRLIRRAVCSSPPPRVLSDAECDRLRAALAAQEGAEGRRDAALFGLMLEAGIRLNSALALDVDDVDLERGELRLRRTKGDRPVVVCLGAAARQDLAPYLATHAGGPLFAARHGGRPSARHVQRRFSELVKKAGIGWSPTPHTLRHTFATRLYRRTGDVYLVKEALKHRFIGSTLIYARPDVERLRAALG